MFVIKEPVWIIEQKARGEVVAIELDDEGEFSYDVRLEHSFVIVPSLGESEIAGYNFLF